MKTISTASRLLKILLFHLPLLGVSSILTYIILLDAPILEGFRSEDTFGLMVAVWIPLGILLGIIQLFIWAKWLVRRGTKSTVKIVKVGFLIILTVFAFFVALRYLS